MQGHAVLVEQPAVVCSQLRLNMTNSFAKMSGNVLIQLCVHCGILWSKFFMNPSLLIKKRYKCCFHLRLRHPGFLRPCFARANPLHTLTLSLWVVLEKPRLVAGYRTFENVFRLNCFKPITANINSTFLLLGKILLNKFGTKLPRTLFVLHN